MHNRAALRNPNTRAQIAASAATAGWHDRHGRDGWWRHRHGGYGWVGPLFWPFAYYDMYDYTMWGYGDDPSFWDYGYNDIYAGMFAPYGYDDLAGYLPRERRSRAAGRRAPRHAAAPSLTPDQLAQMCGDDSRDIAGLPIDQIQQAIQPNDAQRAALDDLANASVKAAQDIKAACPTKIALTAPARLASMQTTDRGDDLGGRTGCSRPLQKFYDLLTDEQKARLNALGQDQRVKREDRAEITPARWRRAAALRNPALPTGQRPRSTRKAASDRRAARQPRRAAGRQRQGRRYAQGLMPDRASAITPPARLEAVGKRLDTMLQAVKTVRARAR